VRQEFNQELNSCVVQLLERLERHSSRQKSTSEYCLTFPETPWFGLLIRRFWVRIPGGAPRKSPGQRP
jgi:hypothetical protein